MSNKILAIDPGYGGTGWALFESGRYYKSGIIRLPAGAKSRLSDEAISKLIMHEFHNLIMKFKPDKVVIETMTFWSGSGKSYVSTAKGDLFKLTMLVGMFFAVCVYADIECKTISANIWKGQLSKKAVKNRLKRYLNIEFREHEADAVGIGLYELGKF